MRKSARAAAVAIMLVCGTAQAAEMVIGSGRARECYLDAERGRTGRIAIETCTKAIDTEALSVRDLAATYVNRGILRQQGGDSAQALKDFDRAIAVDRTQPEAYLNKAAALFKTDDRFLEAIPLFTVAIDMKTRRPELAYFGRGLSNELAGNVRAAYADLKMANQLAPEWDQPAKELLRYSVKRAGG